MSVKSWPVSLAGLVLLILTGLNVPASRAETVFEDGFEAETLNPRWVAYRPETNLADFETRPQYVHSGKQSYRFTVPAGLPEVDSQIRTWLEPGYDELHLRFYAKFAKNFDPGRGMHWVGVSAHDRDDPSFTLGSAGIRPSGRNRFITSLDPVRQRDENGKPIDPPPGKLCFYSYWPDMKASPSGKYWGNYFAPDNPINPERGRWYCIEVMLKGNDPGQANGEQALWVDGEKLIHLKEFRWRDVAKLKVNLITFGLYIRDGIQQCTYWLDDIVVGTDYIGPMDTDK